MKKIWLTLVVVVLMSGLILGGCAEPTPAPSPAPAPAPPAKAVILREAISHTPQDQIGGESIKMADRFTAATGGNYVLEAHTGQALVSLPESFDAVRTGTVEIAQYPIGVFAQADGRFASAELPFLYNNVEANVAALDLLMDDYSAVLEENFNQRLLGVFTATSLDLISTKPVRTMEDWEGLLVQSIAPACAATIEALGGSPVSIPWPDAYTSLDKGVVDAGMFASNQVVIYNLDEVSDYIVPVYMVPTALVAAINLDTWNALPKDIQDLLLEEHMKTAGILNDIFIGLVHEHLVTLADRGMEVISLSEAERARWREALTPYRESSLAEMGAFGQRVQEVADQVNAQYPYQTYGQ